MAVENYGGKMVKKAGADLTGKKYYGGKLDNDGNVVVAAANDAKFIIIEEGKLGESVSIQFAGETKMVAGEAIGAFVKGTSNTDGKLAVADTAGDKAFVMALEAATAAKQIVPVLILNAGIDKTA